MKTKILLTLVSILTTIGALAQIGTITGNVKDGATGEPMTGATVRVTGTALGAIADLDGNFAIKNVKAGTYTVEVSFITYVTKPVAGVVVVANQTTNINVSLDSENKQLGELTITATRKTGTEMSVITELKKADQIAVGVSASQIAKTQDRDASAVIRRVPGVSIQDGRFVVIRGLNESYNTVLLNDVITPSLEVDKKAFSFDLIPAAMIDRMLVFKSGGADIPGEFAGGVIKVYTKNIPDEDFVSVTLQGGYRSTTTFKNAMFNSQGGTSVLGFSHKNDLPSSLGDRITKSTSSEQIKGIDNNWNAVSQKINPDLRVNITTGKKFSIGKVEAGNLTTLTYSNVWNAQEQQRNRYGAYDAQTGKSSEIFNYKDTYANNVVNIGLISNFNFRLNNKTSIDFRNFFNQNGKNETTIRKGYTAEPTEWQNYAFRYEQRSIYSGQLGLTSNLNDNDEVKFTVGFGSTNRSEPDFRRVRYYRDFGSNDAFRAYIPGAATTSDAARFYSKLNETTLTAGGSWEHKIGEIVDNDKFQSKFKAGFYVENKERDFSARWMSYRVSNFSTYDASKEFLPVNQLFDQSNIGPNGYYLDEGTNLSDKYTASNLLAAGYASYSKALTEKLNMVIGFRGEFNHLKLNSFRSVTPVNVDYPKFSPIPSLNLAYNLTEKQILRAAYTYSVNRPEFREFAPFTYYDFNNEANVMGNPDLKVATLNNFDLRWEYYPNPTELITFGAFYKSFKNPIERLIVAGGGNALTYGFANADKANIYGLELEVRKSLEGIFTNKFLERISVLMNASVIQSQVDIKGDAQQISKRALQGQSPYLVNAGLYYNDADNGWQVNLLYNVVGKRIYAVGDAQITASQYEMQRNVIDLNFTKRLGTNFELKGGVNDILNQSYRLIQDSNRDEKIGSKDENILNYKIGTYYTLGFTYKF